MAEHPDDEKLDTTYAAVTKAAEQRQRSSIVEMSLVAGAAILITVSTIFGAWNTFELRELQQDQIEDRQLILLGTECIVEQLFEHRHLTGLAHQANATHHDYVYPIPPEKEPPVIPEVLAQVCQMFIHTTTSTSRP